MKTIFAILVLFACVMLALPMSSQREADARAGLVYGRLDQRTGIFVPIRQVPAETSDNSEEPPTTTYTGKFVVNFTITISSAIPTSTTIACDAAVLVVDSTGDLSDSLSTSATRNGSTATCTVTIPYSWAVTSSSDSVFVSYDVSAPPQPLLSTSPFPRRYSAHPIAKITVPVNGATTTYTVTTTI